VEFRTRLKPSYSLIDLTPLVDVIFLMLIFFLVTSEVLPLKSLLIENPTLTQDAPNKLVQLLVIMDRDQVIYMGSKKEIVELGALKEKLREAIAVLKSQNPASDPVIALHIDRHIDYGIFLKLFSQVQECSSRIRLSFKHVTA